MLDIDALSDKVGNGKVPSNSVGCSFILVIVPLIAQEPLHLK